MHPWGVVGSLRGNVLEVDVGVFVDSNFSAIVTAGVAWETGAVAVNFERPVTFPQSCRLLHLLSFEAITLNVVDYEGIWIDCLGVVLVGRSVWVTCGW